MLRIYPAPCLHVDYYTTDRRGFGRLLQLCRDSLFVRDLSAVGMALAIYVRTASRRMSCNFRIYHGGLTPAGVRKTGDYPSKEIYPTNFPFLTQHQRLCFVTYRSFQCKSRNKKNVRFCRPRLGAVSSVRSTVLESSEEN